jgi:hypothetical protein
MKFKASPHKMCDLSSRIYGSIVLTAFDSGGNPRPLPPPVQIQIQGVELVVSAENADWIPRPPLAGPLVLRADLTFGPHDFALWPQPHDHTAPHLCAILARPAVLKSEPVDGHVLTDDQLLWEPLRAEHCVQHGRADAWALRPELQAELRPLDGPLLEALADLEDRGRAPRALLGTYRTCVERLRAPLRSRELRLVFRALQRTRLEVMAWLAWHAGDGPVEKTRVGCFTTDPGVVAALKKRGIPVWTLEPAHVAARRGVRAEAVDASGLALRGSMDGRAAITQDVHPEENALLADCAVSGATVAAIRGFTQELLGLRTHTGMVPLYPLRRVFLIHSRRIRSLRQHRACQG